MHLTRAQHVAAEELVELIASRVGTNRDIHPETAIAATARLAGSLLLRSFDVPLASCEPGSVLICETANNEGLLLIQIMAAYLAGSGIDLDEQKLGGRSSNATGGEAPRLEFLDTLSLLQDPALAIGARHRLNLVQTAQAAALAMAFFVKECAPQIGAETGFNAAAFGVVEGSKTVPPRASVPRQLLPSKKSRFKFW